MAFLVAGLSPAWVLADTGLTVNAQASASVNSGSDDEGESTPSATPSPSIDWDDVELPRHPIRKFFQCTLEYEPLICPDGKTYSNACFARNQGGWDKDQCDHVVLQPGDPTFNERLQKQLEENRKKLAELEKEREAKLKRYADQIRKQLENDDRFEKCSDSSSRDDCFKAELEIRGSVDSERRSCSSSSDESGCVDKLRDKLRDLWRFRFNALVNSAEKLEANGVSAELIAEFKAFLEKSAVDFEAAADASAKREIVKDVADAWKEFRSKALAQMLEKRLDNATAGIQRALTVLQNLKERLNGAGKETPGLDNAIVRLEANVEVLTSADSTLREKWVAYKKSTWLLSFAKRAAIKHANGQDSEELVEPEVEVSAEVEAAAQASVSTG